jgi:hypothetical protein
VGDLGPPRGVSQLGRCDRNERISGLYDVLVHLLTSAHTHVNNIADGVNRESIESITLFKVRVEVELGSYRRCHCRPGDVMP